MEERFCRVCVCGPVEDEKHVLLECYVYGDLRQKLLENIKEHIAYDLSRMLQDSDFMLNVLIGCGLGDKKKRLCNYRLVANYLMASFRCRENVLNVCKTGNG